MPIPLPLTTHFEYSLPEKQSCDLPIFATSSQGHLRERGGQVVRLYRPGHEPNCEHASEQFDFDTDFEIYNADSVEKLHESILYLAGESALSEATKRG